MMHPRLIKVLLQLYPRNWRVRYGREFICLLEQTSPDLISLLDIAVSAVSERMISIVEDTMLYPVQRALPALFIAWLMAVAAGINLYVSVDDNPLVMVMRSHGSFMHSWIAIEAGSLLGLAAVVAIGAPLLVEMLREASQRPKLLIQLLVLPGTGIVLILWMAEVLLATGGHWAPMPWAVAGDWSAPSGWPSLATRWLFGSTTLILLLAAASSCAILFRRMIRLSTAQFLLRRYFFVRLSINLLAVSLLLMTLGTGFWGFFANQYAHAIFHARFGGLLNLTTFYSWLLSLVLFAVGAVIAAHSTREYNAGTAS